MAGNRPIVLAAMAALTALTGCAATPVAALGREPPLTVDTFRNPPMSVRPIYRWWLPLAAVEPDELRRELDQMAEAGAGGVEVAAMPVPGDIGRDPAFLRQYGFGTPRWSSTLETIFGKANERNLRVDMMVGPLWPTAMPSVNSLNDPAAQQKLVAGFAQIAPGADWAAPLPLPEKELPSVKTRLCAPVQVGQRRATVRSDAGLGVGDVITLGEGDGAEHVTIAALLVRPSAPCGIIDLATPATRSHPVDSLVVDEARRTLIAVLAARCLGAECVATGASDCWIPHQ